MARLRLMFRAEIWFWQVSYGPVSKFVIYIPLRSILKLSSPLYLDLQSGLLLSGFSTKILYAFPV
jgi:hypothetical protein